jgi:lipoprotein-anchoring transpeptidase ErfK/SrfK
VTNGKQIIVDLSDQRIFANQDVSSSITVIVSTGLPGTPTVTGDFNVYWKLTSQTMSGPGYYLPGVPWVMYFYAGYAIHGTYWHNNFGQPMSHGCVNLPTDQAAWFFNFAEVGTPVRVIY